MIGGYVYRGSAIPALVGAYVFALRRFLDGGKVWKLRHDGVSITELEEIQDELNSRNEPGFIVDNMGTFGEDAAGELYICDAKPDGQIFKIVPGFTCLADCGTVEGIVGTADLMALLADWGGPGPCDLDPEPRGDGISFGPLDLVISFVAAAHAVVQTGLPVEELRFHPRGRPGVFHRVLKLNAAAFVTHVDLLKVVPRPLDPIVKLHRIGHEIVKLPARRVTIAVERPTVFDDDGTRRGIVRDDPAAEAPLRKDRSLPYCLR